MKHFIIPCLFVVNMVFFSSCGNLKKVGGTYPELKAWVDSMQQKYVPDTREDVYEISIGTFDRRPVLKGYTSVGKAKSELLKKIREKLPSVIDSIEILPESKDGKIYGIVNLSVADVRMQPSLDAEMGTQVLLGSPLLILQEGEYWCRIKTAEGYIGWISDDSFVAFSKEEFNAWTQSDKIIFTSDYGFGYESPDSEGQHSSDLVFGNLLQYEGENGDFYQVVYPDKRRAFVPKSQCAPFRFWLSSIKLTEESVLKKALSLKGTPYTWGGTSVKGMDCSGFTKTVMLMHGIVLKRDASQQAQWGLPVDISKGYENLRPGDLMFFGEKPSKGKKGYIRHVGLYMGNKEFIHDLGFVRINSLDSTKRNFDREETKDFILARRIIGAVGSEGIRPINRLPLYNEQK